MDRVDQWRDDAVLAQRFKDRLTRLRKLGASANFAALMWECGPTGVIFVQLDEHPDEDMVVSLIDVYNEAVAKVEADDVAAQVKG